MKAFRASRLSEVRDRLNIYIEKSNLDDSNKYEFQFVFDKLFLDLDECLQVYEMDMVINLRFRIKTEEAVQMLFKWGEDKYRKAIGLDAIYDLNDEYLKSVIQVLCSKIKKCNVDYERISEILESR